MPDSRHEVLLAKLKNTMSNTQLALLNSKINQLVIDLSPWGGNEYLKENLVKIRKAIEGRREVDFLYADSSGNRTGRRVEPYSLVLKAQKWYLYAWCHTRTGDGENIANEWLGEDMVRLEDGRILAKVAVPENNWLYGFILSFGTGVEVVNPPHIRTILAAIAAGIHQKYSQES